MDSDSQVEYGRRTFAVWFFSFPSPAEAEAIHTDIYFDACRLSVTHVPVL